MIPEQAIRAECSPQAYLRAQALAKRTSAFRSLVVSANESRGVRTTKISGGVQSSDRRTHYRSTVLFDEKLGTINDYYCDCAYGSNYNGMCKHAAALMLRYNDKPESFMGFAGKNREHDSSPELLELMARESNHPGEVPVSNIELEPTFRHYFGNWDVRFKVTDGEASYVLKNIGDFLQRMSEGAYYAYGKKLAFTHVPERLTERSQKIYAFLERAAARRSSLASSGMGYFYDYGFGNAHGHAAHMARDLSLSDDEVIELFDLLADEPLFIQNDEPVREVDDWLMRATAKEGATEVHVVDENPDLHIEIRETDDGYGITPPDESTLIASGMRLYVWRGRTLYRCTPDFARIARIVETLYETNGLFVAKRDVPAFCATMLPLLEKALPIAVPESMQKMRPVACKLSFYFDADKNFVYGRCQAAYGDVTFALPLDGEPDRSIVHDYVAEQRALDLISEYIPAGDIDMHDSDAVAALLLGGLARFKEIGEVFTTPAFDKLLFTRKPHINAGLSIAGNLINMNLASDEIDPHEVAALLQSYRKHKHYHRLKSGAFLSLADMDLQQLSRVIDDLDISQKDLAKGTVELPAYQAFYLDSELDSAFRDRTFNEYIERFNTASKRKRTVPKPLRDVLRPYQVDGFEWLCLIADSGFGGILADEMGLGKSVQFITWLLANRTAAQKVGPSLIVCPASLVYNWVAEFERFAPMMDVVPVAGTKTERRATLAKATAGPHPAEVLVTSYDLMRIDIEEFSALDLYGCALDEAQYIKNHTTKAARAAKRLHAEHRFALTGTPMENRPSELWSIFDYLMPGLLGSPMHFREKFEIPVLGGDEEATARLRALVSPFILRRTKADELADLPDKLESVVYTSLEGEQRKVYTASEQNLRNRLNVQKRRSASRGGTAGAVRNAGQAAKRRSKRPVLRDLEEGVEVDPLSKVEVLAEITRLRQICLDPALVFDNYHGHSAKLATIKSLVEQGIDAERKMLVFSQFTSFLDEIARMLADAGITFYTLTGATKKEKRIELVNAFNHDDTPVFLISLKAGGTGLNLTGANLVILTDPWWNAAVQEQASDRAHRIGQTREVDVIKVIAKDTIEERILDLQETKSTLADSLVGKGGSLASLTTDDLIDLLG